MEGWGLDPGVGAGRGEGGREGGARRFKEDTRWTTTRQMVRKTHRTVLMRQRQHLSEPEA